MVRTKQRALVKGNVNSQPALIYASMLGLLGFCLLGFFTNLVALGLAVVGFVFYVFLYAYTKRRTSVGTLVGAVAGAVPIVVGYCAASGRFDLAALLLFLILFFWQLPHFYAIAMYRFHDYKAAGLPVLPVKRGMRVSKMMIVFYVFAFFVATSLLFVFGYAGYIYLAVMLALNFAWFFYGIQRVKDIDYSLWARKMFRVSLVVLLVFSVMISLERYLV